MLNLASTGRLACWTATAGMIALPAVRAADGVTPPPQALVPLPPVLADADPAAAMASAFHVTDVALDEGGCLNGQAVNRQGEPLAHEAVVLDDGQRRFETTTDEQGRFRFDRVRGGAYRVQVVGQSQFCRAWMHGTEPPAANRGLMLVHGEPTVLAQYCGSPIGCGSPVGAGFEGCRELLRNPWVIGGIIAAAIAIPVAIHNMDDDEPAS